MGDFEKVPDLLSGSFLPQESLWDLFEDARDFLIMDLSVLEEVNVNLERDL